MARTSAASQSLFNILTIQRTLATTDFRPSNDQLEAAAEWAARARSSSFAKEKEKALQGLFKHEIVERVLGYVPLRTDRPYSVAQEEPAGAGSVDLALGEFTAISRRVLAPFELKGPKTRDLDAIMPGRAKSPVQQAFEYALDLVGSKWVVVSNLVEIRLYAFGHGRIVFERFDLSRLDDATELKRLCLLLGADNLLSGQTAALLEKSQRAHKEITDSLYEDYKALRDRLIDSLDRDHPDIGRLRAIEHAQTILDRVLFIAFAEDNDLLPQDTIHAALAKQNDFAPVPLWDVFRGLFRAIDKGKTRKDKDGNNIIVIHAYNGGLFAPDKDLDELTVPDELCDEFERLARYDFRRDVSVEVLGHVFEQSITDIEAMQALARGDEEPTASKRKREGVVYTPAFVTRFIVEQTIGRTLEERFLDLLPRYARGKNPPPPGEEVAWRSARAEREFWEAYRETLRSLTVIDPACGSGAFLIAAFDFLSIEYRRVNDRLAEIGRRGSDTSVLTGTLGLFDPDAEVLAHNLFGVDVNTASVEITKLSIWIKTAKRGKVLDSLSDNIRVGNSLIEDSDFHQRAFVWREAFPEIFKQGGFDIVVGNPPYVRMELIKPFKPYLEQRFEVVADRADLYAYFFEQGVRLIKRSTGRLGYISSSTFFRTGSGKPLRRFLASNTALEAVVDFGDLQLFEGVTTYPAIVSLRRLAEGEEVSGDVRYKAIRGRLPDDLTTMFHSEAASMPRDRLAAGGWMFEGTGPATLRAKLRERHRMLGEVYGAPLYGIKTGLNSAFVVNKATRNRLVATDPKATEILKPFLRGENIKRWRVEPDDLFLINTPKGKIDIDQYPSVRDHLLPFKAALEARATKQHWFELQQAQFAYQACFAEPKIMYGHFAANRIFCFDNQGLFPNDKGYAIPSSDFFLLALLNSKLEWFILSGLAPAVRGGYHEMRVQYLEVLPIPDASPEVRLELSGLAAKCQSFASDRQIIIRSVRRRIPDLYPVGHDVKLSAKLHDWWRLDFSTFRRELKKVCKLDVPLADRNEWETYLEAEAAKVRHLSVELHRTETKIDQIVYDLFGLSPAEIDIVESTVGAETGRRAA